MQKRPFLKKGSGLRRFYPDGPDVVHLPSPAIKPHVPTKPDKLPDPDPEDTSVGQDKELELFELMERLTNSTSFCSESSVVGAFVSTAMKVSSSASSPSHSRHSSSSTSSSSTTKAQIVQTVDPYSDVSPAVRNKMLTNGAIETTYENGTVKIVDGDLTVIRYFNGDIRQTNKATGAITYYYKVADLWHCIHPDGSEQLQHSGGHIENKKPDGTSEIVFTDGRRITLRPDGTQIHNFSNGDRIVTRSNGDKVFQYTNGQTETYTKDFVRRSYPDGTVRTVYNESGLQETKYSNGLFRVKDRSGKVIAETMSPRMPAPHS